MRNVIAISDHLDNFYRELCLEKFDDYTDEQKEKDTRLCASIQRLLHEFSVFENLTDCDELNVLSDSLSDCEFDVIESNDFGNYETSYSKLSKNDFEFVVQIQIDKY